MVQKIEYAPTFQGYSPYNQNLHQQRLGFAVIKGEIQYAGENPYIGDQTILSSSTIGEMLNPASDQHHEKTINRNGEIAMNAGILFAQWVRVYLEQRLDYTPKPLTSRLKPQRSRFRTKENHPEAVGIKPLTPKTPEAILLDAWEYLTKYSPELLEDEFRPAVKLFHQFHLTYPHSPFGRVEEQFKLKISYDLPEDKLISSMAKNLPEAINIFDFYNLDPNKPKILAARMSLVQAQLLGKYDLVEEVPKADGKGLPERLIPWEIKRSVDEQNTNANDLLQLFVQNLSFYPHRLDRLSIHNIPPFEGRFYDYRQGGIYQVNSLNSAITTLEGVQTLDWVNQAALLEPGGDADQKNLRQTRKQIADMFGRHFDEPELELGNRRFNIQNCLDSAKRCQSLLIATLKQEKIAEVEEGAPILTDEEIDKVLQQAFKKGWQWREIHDLELAERKLVAMAEQTGMVVKIRGVKGADKWVEKVTRGAAPIPPSLPEPDRSQAGKYLFTLTPSKPSAPLIAPGSLKNEKGTKARQTEYSSDSSAAIGFLKMKYPDQRMFMQPIDFIVGKFASDTQIDYRMMLKTFGLEGLPAIGQLETLANNYQQSQEYQVLKDMAEKVAARPYILINTPQQILMFSFLRQLWRSFDPQEHSRYLQAVINNPNCQIKFGTDVKTEPASEMEKNITVLDGARASGYSDYFWNLGLKNGAFGMDSDLVIGKATPDKIYYHAVVELTQSRFNFATQNYLNNIIERFDRQKLGHRQVQGRVIRDLAQRFDAQAAILLYPPGNPANWHWLKVYRFGPQNWDHYNINNGKLKKTGLRLPV